MEKVFTLAEYRRLLVLGTALNDETMLRVLDKLAIDDNGAYRPEQGQRVLKPRTSKNVPWYVREFYRFINKEKEVN